MDGYGWDGKGKGKEYGYSWDGGGKGDWAKGGKGDWGWNGGGGYGPAWDKGKGKGKDWGPPPGAYDWGPYGAPMKGKGKPEGKGKPHRQYDPETEQMLDDWVTAKRTRDFGIADKLRDELRERGVEPDSARPPESGGGQSTAPSWEQKGGGKGKDAWGWGPSWDSWGWGPPPPWAWGPDSWGPSWGYDPYGKGKGGPPPAERPRIQRYDAEIEQLLDKWVQAKRGKDFAAADSIRAELRARDIDPDAARPPGSTDAKALARTTAAKFSNDQKVFIGSIPQGYNVDQVKAVFAQADSHPAFVSVSAEKGQGLACFNTVDEAAEAIIALNGASLDEGLPPLTLKSWKK